MCDGTDLVHTYQNVSFLVRLNSNFAYDDKLTWCSDIVNRSPAVERSYSVVTYQDLKPRTASVAEAAYTDLRLRNSNKLTSGRNEDNSKNIYENANTDNNYEQCEYEDVS